LIGFDRRETERGAVRPPEILSYSRLLNINRLITDNSSAAGTSLDAIDDASYSFPRNGQDAPCVG
jgi:hypothetical protein